MPSTRDIERAERNGRFRSRRRGSTSSDVNRHSFDGTDKRHRRHGKSKNSGKKKKKRSRDKSLENVPTVASSVVKPLVEYSDVSSEDLSEPEAGEIQSEDSRANSYTDGEVPESLLQRRYYGGTSVPRTLGASPISLSPSPPVQHRHAISRRYSSPNEQQQSTTMHGATTPEYEEESRRYARRKEKKHKREKKKKRSLSPLSNSGKKKKRKSKRHSDSISPHHVVVEDIILSPDREKQSSVTAGTTNWSESPPLPLKDSTSPISPATPQEHRCPSDDVELEMSRQTSRNVTPPSLLPTRQTESPHTPLLPPRATTPESLNKVVPKHGSPDRQKRSPSIHAMRRTSMSPVPIGSSRRRPHSPSPPSRRRDHSPPPRRRDFSPTPVLHRLRHSPSPTTVRRREFSPSPVGSHRRRTDSVSSPKRRRRDESDRRHRHHDKDRRDKRKSRSTRSPTGSRSRRIILLYYYLCRYVCVYVCMCLIYMIYLYISQDVYK